MQGSLIRRKLKNTVKNFTEAEKLVREATSNDPWGPSSSLMSDISELTYNVMALPEIMTMLWKRVNDKQKNWRHIYKSLVLIDYVLKTGSPQFKDHCCHHIHSIRTLVDFQYFEEHKDLGHNVREKSKAVLRLLEDPDLLIAERARCLAAKEKFSREATGIGSDTSMRYGLGSGSQRSSRYPANLPDRPLSDGGMYPSLPQGSDSTPELSGGNPTPSSVSGTRRGDIGSSAVKKLGEDSKKLETDLDEDLQLQLAIALSRELHETQLRQQQEIESKEAARLQLAIDASLKEDPKPLISLKHEMSSDRRSKQLISCNVGPWGETATNNDKFDPWSGGDHLLSTDYDGFGDKAFPRGSSSVPTSSQMLTTTANAGSNSKSATVAQELEDFFSSFSLSTPPKSVPSQNLNGAVFDPFTGLQEINSDNGPKHKSLTSGTADSNADWTDFVQVNGNLSCTNTSSEQKGNQIRDFLCENSALVDVDNILSKAKVNGMAQKNPFVPSSSVSSCTAPVNNPFMSTQSAPPKLSLNTLANQQRDYHSPINDPWSSSIAPTNHYVPPPSVQPQSSFNPFL